MSVGCKAEYKIFDAEGRWIAGGHLYLPESLDWISIDVKAHWFKFMGQGPEEGKFALLISQGEQRLIPNVTLTPLDFKQYKERLESSHDEIEKFIDGGRYSRTPRNQ